MNLEKCFNKFFKQILGIRVSQLNLEEQFRLLKFFPNALSPILFQPDNEWESSLSFV